MIGDPARDREALEAVSPAKRMDAIKAPLLIAHGKLDPRVSHEDALSLVKNLKKRGVLVRSLIFEDEGHWITGEANRIRFYLALEEFLNAYLKAGKPGGT
jgi:dipeptidyl aminopeptidase/acylaminoacyl peptidase